MKPRDKGGVLDERLNVYGVEGLKVAGTLFTVEGPLVWISESPFSDLSIMPSNVAANTYNTAVAIGEKAAVIIAQDLGIKGVAESD
jgi:alcohol oxidase